MAMFLEKLSSEEVNYVNEKGDTALILAVIDDKPDLKNEYKKYKRIQYASSTLKCNS